MSLLGGLVTIKILSNMLAKEEFGTYSLLFSVVSFLVAVLFTTLGQINLRYIFIALALGRIANFRKMQTRMFTGVLGVSALVIIPCVFWFSSAGSSLGLTYFALILLTFVMGYQIAQQYSLMSFRARKEIGLAQTAGAISRPLGVFLCILWLGANPVYALLGLAFGFSVPALIQRRYLAGIWRSRRATSKPASQTSMVDTAAMRPVRILSYGFTYALIGLVTITVLAADRWVLSIFGTLEQVAIYAALMQIALAPAALGHAVLARLATPIIFGGQGLPAKVKKQRFRLLVLVWVAMCAVIFVVTNLFHYQIVRLLTNESFAIYSYLLPWMVTAMLFERTNQMLEIKGAMLLKTHLYILPRLLLVIAIPVLEYLFFSTYGFDWLVVGLVVATGAGMVATSFINGLFTVWK